MIPRTLDELLQSVAAKMQAWMGNNPLNNPVANRSNPLVKLITAAMQGQSDLERRVEAWGYSARIDQLSGNALDVAAGRKCLTRKLCTTTKQLITVMGDDCAVMPTGSVLLDSQGREWVTAGDISLQNNGAYLASGTGIAESSECGCWIIDDGELSINPEDYIGILSATNSYQLEKGGEEESDGAFRHRILNTGPLANVKGTTDYAVAELLKLDGVAFVRTFQGNACGQVGFMFIVKCGNPNDICDTIRRSGAVSTMLIGETQCRDDCFDNVRYQEPVPVKLNIEVTLNCDCPQITEEQAEIMVKSQAMRTAGMIKISSSMYSKLHPDIDSVRLSVERKPLVTCPATETLEDPLCDQDVLWGTSNPCGISGGSMKCDPRWINTVQLQPWEFLIIGDVTFADCPEPEVRCVSA